MGTGDKGAMRHIQSAASAGGNHIRSDFREGLYFDGYGFSCGNNESSRLDFGHSGVYPLQIRQERAGAVQKLYEVWSEDRHHEIP